MLGRQQDDDSVAAARRPKSVLGWLSAVVALAGLALLAGWTPARADAAADIAAAREAAEAERGGDGEASSVPYSVEFTGTAPDDLVDKVRAASSLIRDQDNPPFSRAGLGQRVRSDRQTFQQVMNAQGYYQPEVTVAVSEATPAVVTFTLTPGPRTTLASVNITYAPRPGLDKLDKPTLADLGLTLGEPAVSQPILDAEAFLIADLQDNGFPDTEVVDRRVTVDLNSNEMTVTLSVDSGPYMVFGPLAIDGLDRTEEEYLRRVLRWPEGETFSDEQLNLVRRRAVATNLFSEVQITRASTQQRSGEAEPVTMKLQERPPRTISLGLGFATDFSNTPFGFIGEAAWEHRNILGRGESLRLSANAQPDEQVGAVLFNKPNWFINDQSLQWRFNITNEDQPAFKQLSAETSLGVERILARHLTGFAGGALKYLRSDDLNPDTPEGRDDYILYSIPTRLTYDNRDDRLDATKGFLGVLGIAPTLVTVTDTAFYLQADVMGTHYQRVLEDPDIVLAGRARVASLVGTAISNIPAGERLYAGGGGSVRGYEVDSLGPLDSENDAIGGRSLIEFGIEARWRFWDDYGIVPFLDAGQVYNGMAPDFSDTIQYAAGLGFRYYSPIGPIRLDFAHPINKRQRDRELQFYISIGQAF
ncbi:MAG: autotransporter assembly complex family protein [Pseudomonadota bacterium]